MIIRGPPFCPPALIPQLPHSMRTNTPRSSRRQAAAQLRQAEIARRGQGVGLGSSGHGGANRALVANRESPDRCEISPWLWTDQRAAQYPAEASAAGKTPVWAIQLPASHGHRWLASWLAPGPAPHPHNAAPFPI